MSTPKELKPLYIKSEPLYYRENFEGKKINSTLIFENFKKHIIELIEVQIKFAIFHNVLISICDKQNKNLCLDTVNELKMCIECCNYIYENLLKILTPVCETMTKM